MKRILHILTHPAKPEVEQLILDQQRLVGFDQLVVDHCLDRLAAVVELEDRHPAALAVNEENPDYKLLLEKVFQSDSIQCW